jgi:phospholipase C
VRRWNLDLTRTLAVPAGMSRRDMLLGSLAAAAACATPDPEDSAAAPEPGSIDTIVVLMMENRSFDHFLGSLKLVEGRDVDGLTAEMSNADADGVVYPVVPTQVTCLADPPHSWSPAHEQFDDGANDGFVRAYAERGASEPGEVMGYHVRADLPITYALTDAYCLCDRYFCSVMGPTWPNRMYAHAGTSDGQDDNSLPEGGGFTFPTVWTKLDEAGVAWRYYYVDLPFLGLFANHLRDGTWAFLEDFIDDAADGTLPPVVWIDPGFTFDDDHPPHHPGLGQELIARVYKALASSPQWKRCLFLITYDEHGGFFDHVPPPTTDDDFAEQGFDQLGFRVPSIVIGPWVRAGVDSTEYNHASWIKYVCERFGIEPWTKRIAAANSLANALDADRMAAGDPLPAASVPDFDIDDASVPPECSYGDNVLLVHPQPELAEFVMRYYPALDRSNEADAIARRIRGA